MPGPVSVTWTVKAPASPRLATPRVPPPFIASMALRMTLSNTWRSCRGSTR